MRRRVAPTSHYFRRCHQPKNRPVAIPTSVGAARSCQIVMLNSVSVILPPLLQWQRFAAILNLSGVKLAPVMLPVNTEQCAGVFSFQPQGHRGSSPRNIAPHRVAPAYG
nr:nucleoside efflux transporter ImpX [Salmonella enterica]